MCDNHQHACPRKLYIASSISNCSCPGALCSKLLRNCLQKKKLLRSCLKSGKLVQICASHTASLSVKVISFLACSENSWYTFRVLKCSQHGKYGVVHDELYQTHILVATSRPVYTPLTGHLCSYVQGSVPILQRWPVKQSH